MNASNSVKLIEQLTDVQNNMLAIFQQQCVADFMVQYHPALSPVGWHLGHCVYTEIFWIQERLLGISTDIDEKLRQYYIPESSPKEQRKFNLPEFSELVQWASTTQKKNIRLLKQHQNMHDHVLMQHDFLLHFLIQHYAQHSETIAMILTQRSLQKNTDFVAKRHLKPSPINTQNTLLHAGEYMVGAQTKRLPYDNEYPSHKVTIENDVKIAEYSVTNSEFFSFMQQAGYQKSCYWSDAGWQWREKNMIACPAYWKQDKQGQWFELDQKGPHDLVPDHAVKGLSFYEAEAFANWAGGQLPHEHEWEISIGHNLLKNIGQAWEWCRNTFYPYPREDAEFTAFPYEGYSKPYFDDKHFVMRGASKYTHASIRRNSFRNFYQADKRHHFAGVRLIFN